MRGIWLLLTIAAVVIIAGILIIFGSRSGELDRELDASIQKLTQTEEYKAAIEAIDELQAAVKAAAVKTEESLAKLIQDLKAEADPELAAAKKELDELVGRLSKELDGLKSELDVAARDLKKDWVDLKEDARRKGAETLVKARIEARKLEDSLAETIREVELAASLKGVEAINALDNQKAKLEEHIEKVGGVKEGVDKGRQGEPIEY